MSDYKSQVFDICLEKVKIKLASYLYTTLLGANYKQSDESTEVNGAVIPTSGTRGYYTYSQIPNLGTGFDPSTLGLAGTDNSPQPWYRDARIAWYNGLRSTITQDLYKVGKGGKDVAMLSSGASDTTNTNTKNGLIGAVDPIAQSFFVTEDAVIVTKIDLFFYTKDTNLPVYLELRKMVSGAPGPDIIPFGRAVVQSNFVVVSDDATKPTTFIFESPVHLESGEYAFVIRTDSANYKLWASQLNDVDVVKKTRITEQPTVGSYFKSQNLTNWTEDPIVDLKFTLFRADFDITSIGTPEFSILAPTYDTITLDTDPLEFFPNVNYMRVYAPNHGNATGDVVSLAGVNFTTSIIDSNTETLNTTYQVIKANKDDFIVQLNNVANANVITRATRAGGKGIVLSGSKNILYDTLVPEVATYVPKNTSLQAFVKTVEESSRGYRYQYVDLASPYNFENMQVLLSSKNKGNMAQDYNTIYPGLRNFEPFHVVFPITSENTLVSPLIDIKKINFNFVKSDLDSGSLLPYNQTTVDQTLVFTNSNVYVSVEDGAYRTSRIYVQYPRERANVNQYVREGSLILYNVPKQNATVSYRVDSVENTGANIFVTELTPPYVPMFAHITNHDGTSQNNTNMYVNTYYVFDTASKGSTTPAQHITKEFKFANPSSGITAYIDACIPEGTLITMMYRTKQVGEADTSIDDKPFKYFEQTKLSKLVTDKNKFVEVSVNAENIPLFESLQIKIVFNRNTKSGLVPRVKNLRVIALA
jgi:hypothetical protein